MGTYEIYYGLFGASFGYRDNFKTYEEALSTARNLALEEYGYFEGGKHFPSIDDIGYDYCREHNIDDIESLTPSEESQIRLAYEKARENVIRYHVIKVV